MIDEPTTEFLSRALAAGARSPEQSVRLKRGLQIVDRRLAGDSLAEVAASCARFNSRQRVVGESLSTERVRQLEGHALRNIADALGEDRAVYLAAYRRRVAEAVAERRRRARAERGA